MKLKWWKTKAEKEAEEYEKEYDLRSKILAQITEEFEAKKIAEEAEQARLKAEEEERDRKAKEAVELKLKLEEDARLKAEEELKQSQTPWFDIKHIYETSDGQSRIKVEMDWNEAFIKHLRENGYTGSNDDEVIQKYIALTARQVADDMGNDLTSGLE